METSASNIFDQLALPKQIRLIDQQIDQRRVAGWNREDFGACIASPGTKRGNEHMCIHQSKQVGENINHKFDRDGTKSKKKWVVSNRRTYSHRRAAGDLDAVEHE
jgi:hypothetical protein